ncbi:MAG: ABC transporter permease subunit [Hyphomicrobiales bacterium]|nr:ABC transporter permease subunit [Hyphomicrobiales bacterium]
MLLLLCPLVGYSLFQAVALYGEASAAARDQPSLAVSLSPLDGVLVPTFGAFYLAVTLLFPFVAIRVLGREKETGTLRLLVQLPYPVPVLVGAKMAAIGAAWLAAAVPALSALAIWYLLGGHLSAPETLNLLLGHLLYGILVGAVGLFAAAVADGAATAAIITLAFALGSWVLDFALAGQPGLQDLLARLSFTRVLRGFEQGLLSTGVLIGVIVASAGFAALAAVWLHPGVALRSKLRRSTACVGVVVLVLGIVAALPTPSFDLSEDGRNSFPPADQLALAALSKPLTITVHLAPEDPRYTDLRRNVLAKLERVVPDVTVRFGGTARTVIAGSSDDRYGEIEYVYEGRTDRSRSTSPREILPLIYALAGTPMPRPLEASDYPGYPLVTAGALALLWFLGALPILIIIAWWWSSRPPRLRPALIATGGSS